MAGKERVLHLLKYLQDNTDEEHPVSTAQIRSALAALDCPVTVETLRSDIASLRRAGYDIIINEKSGLPTTYSYIDRTLENPELLMLIDAVSASQCISQNWSRRLVSKLIAMSSPTLREELSPEILATTGVKTSNSQLFYTVHSIRQAICADRRITFQYYHYDLEKRRVPRHGGRLYVVSPYTTVWKHERYYLVGWMDEAQKMRIFRMDRMDVPKLTDQKRVPPPADFDGQDYVDRYFSMYGSGPIEAVTLRCHRDTIDHIIDHFGKEVELFNITEQTFDVRVRVSVSATFFAWIFTYAGEMSVVSPQHVKDAYRQMLQRGLEDGS